MIFIPLQLTLYIFLLLKHGNLYPFNTIFYFVITLFTLIILGYVASNQNKYQLSIYVLSLAFYEIHIIQMYCAPQFILSIIPLLWMSLLISCFAHHYFTWLIHVLIMGSSLLVIQHLGYTHEVANSQYKDLIAVFTLYYLISCMVLFFYLHKTTEQYLSYLSKQQQQIQRERRKAEQAQQNKEYFLANMSHELRTPLNAILGYADYHLESVDLGLLSELGQTTTLEVQQQLLVIQKAGHQLLQCVDDLLQVSQLVAETRSLSLNLLSLEDLNQKLQQTQLRPDDQHPAPSIKCKGQLHTYFTTDHKYLCRLIKLLCDQLYNYNIEAKPEVILKGKDNRLDIDIYDASHLQTSIVDILQKKIPVSDLLSRHSQQGLLVCLKLCDLLEIEMNIDNDDERIRFWLEVPSLNKSMFYSGLS